MKIPISPKPPNDYIGICGSGPGSTLSTMILWHPQEGSDHSSIRNMFFCQCSRGERKSNPPFLTWGVQFFIINNKMLNLSLSLVGWVDLRQWVTFIAKRVEIGGREGLLECETAGVWVMDPKGLLTGRLKMGSGWHLSLSIWLCHEGKGGRICHLLGTGKRPFLDFTLVCFPQYLRRSCRCKIGLAAWDWKYVNQSFSSNSLIFYKLRRCFTLENYFLISFSQPDILHNYNNWFLSMAPPFCRKSVGDKLCKILLWSRMPFYSV